jgi:hypothetical protein
MFYKEDWFSWSYNNISCGPKTTPMSVFDFKIKKIVSRPIKSYRNELIENAKLIRDRFSEKFDLLLSGGIDSEIILRIYHSLKIPINVYIFEYENEYNRRDVIQALALCEELKITPKIIHFNLKKFFENDADSIFSKIYCGSSGRLPHMKMSEYVDNIPIYGSGEPYWIKIDDTWKYEFDEDARSWTVYHKTIGRNAICDWYEYSPELIIAHTKLPKIQELINNQIPGKISSNSSKILIHRDIWPNVIDRPKMVGFEGHMRPSRYSKPDFMLEFDNHIKNKVQIRVDHFDQSALMDLLGYS